MIWNYSFFVDKKLRIAGIIAALAFSIFILTSSSDPLPIPEPPSSKPENNSVETLAENLDEPRSIAVSDNRIFVTEKDGLIRVIQDNILLDETLATLRPANVFTNGGFLKFCPDKKLYVGTGTVSDSSHLPQDLDSLSGKILRLNDDGTIPEDNPFPNSPVYSLGHRNPQGMTWDNTGQMYLAELGPEKNDEINLIKPGKNYGWPEQQCKGDEKFENAIMCYDPSIEPGGILFYSGDKINLEADFVMASLRATNLYQLDFADGLNSQKTILSGAGRIRDVVQSPDGSLYVIDRK